MNKANNYSQRHDRRYENIDHTEVTKPQQQMETTQQQKKKTNFILENIIIFRELYIEVVH
jgi:hypothetical protein